MQSPGHPSLTPQGEPLATYVSRIRALRGLSRAELARRAGVHLTSLLRIEAGKVSGVKMRTEVQRRLAVALQIPVEYLRAACRGELLESRQTNLVCSSCWVPGTSADVRWSLADAKFCLRCGERLRNMCPYCGEPILLTARFCPQCGKSYAA